MFGKKDLVIISNLRSNSRKTLTEIAKQSRMPISTVFEKLKRNEGDIIKKYTCLVDFAKLGFIARAKIVIQVNVEYKKQLLDFLLKNQNVNNVYKINNGYDYLIESIFKSIGGLEEFLEMLRIKFKVKKQETYYIIDDLKQEMFMTDPKSIDLLTT